MRRQAKLYRYDQLNRKTEETVTFGPFSKTYRYSYDGAGNKASFTTPEGTVYSYSYNKNNQLTAIAMNGTTIGLEYQWLRQTKLNLPANVSTSYSYNNNNWLAAIETQLNSSALSSQHTSFDKVGNITHKTTELGSTAYGYDTTYQLTQAGAEGFSYDPNGNRTSNGGSANANNQLLQSGTASYSYDANGNLTSTTENGQTTGYSYDARNRLTQVTLPNGGTVSYGYDPFNRRISKTVNGSTTYYLYAEEGLIAEYTADGTASSSYAWRPDRSWGTDPLLMQRNNRSYYYLNDHLGTPQKLVDEQGAIVWAASYGAFGKAQVTTALVTNNLRFPGQYWDEETGLHYNWNRYYDPGTGRYTQEDPIGFEAGDENLYRYVGNNVPNAYDETGEYLVPAVIVVGTAIALVLNNPGSANAPGPSDELEASGDIQGIIVGGLLRGIKIPGGIGGKIVKGGINKQCKLPSKTGGRSGKQDRLRELANDDKLGAADRGWLKNDMRHVEYGNKPGLRVPRNGRKSPGRKGEDKGYELAHPYDSPASKGNSHAGSKLKNHADHKVETRLQRGRY